jgi:hypothetical protein
MVRLGDNCQKNLNSEKYFYMSDAELSRATAADLNGP